MLNINKLNVTYYTNNACKQAVRNFNISIKQGEIVGIVGESGSGKTTVANAILQMLPNHTETSGVIKLDGTVLNKYNIQKNRGLNISYISQNFYASISNYFTIESQFDYLLKSISDLTKSNRTKKMRNVLSNLGFENPKEILHKYPFQLAGGMRQRIVIAMAISCEPKVLIADEPTSAVDTIIKGKLLNILYDLNKNKNLGILLISHDLPLVANFCKRIAVMFNGEIIEEGSSQSIFHNAIHPYTKLLLKSKPDFKKTILSEKRRINYGNSPCSYFPWCDEAIEICNRELKENIAYHHYLKCNIGLSNA